MSENEFDNDSLQDTIRMLENEGFYPSGYGCPECGSNLWEKWRDWSDGIQERTIICQDCEFSEVSYDA